MTRFVTHIKSLARRAATRHTVLATRVTNVGRRARGPDYEVVRARSATDAAPGVQLPRAERVSVNRAAGLRARGTSVALRVCEPANCVR